MNVNKKMKEPVIHVALIHHGILIFPQKAKHSIKLHQMHDLHSLLHVLIANINLSDKVSKRLAVNRPIIISNNCVNGDNGRKRPVIWAEIEMGTY